MSKYSVIFLALGAVVLLGAVGTNNGNKSFDTKDMTYGGPEAKITASILPGPIMEGATSLPNAPKLASTRELTVRLDVTHKIQEVADGVKMLMWTFGGEIPGPTVRVRQGDKIHFIMANRSTETAKIAPPMPHSMDFHASMVSPQDKFRALLPNQTLEFDFVANYPGVYMYHCGTPMILHHLAMGMYGVVIVEPREGYPTKVDREYVIVQSEFYPSDKTDKKTGLRELDMAAVKTKRASVVAFNGKAMRHVSEPLIAKVGERVRLFVLNAGPSGTSSFHVVGTIWDRVWFDGIPHNEFRGGQSVLLGASNSAIVEFVIPEKGKYVMVDHEFADANAGAIGLIDATDDKGAK
ncbi:MAG: multicopper oxidase domain-containing protein [Oligoflexia bacterium]|nr:multicopper oxidase domain-containing protein [Oligoflexia bacterium]